MWTGKGEVSDAYNDFELPYPNAKVPVKLRVEGSCFYQHNNEIHLEEAMTNQFILSHVAPKFRE